MNFSILTPDTCAYCGASPVYESCWTDNDGKVHNIWLCARCDERGLKELMDFWSEGDRDGSPL